MHLKKVRIFPLTRIIEEYKNQQNIASLPRPSLLQDLNPIDYVWDKLGWRVWNREPAVLKTLWILLDSTAGVGQDFMSWAHVPSEFNDENVQSCCSRPWPAAYINIIQNTHQIQVLTKPLCRAHYILFAAEQRVGYQIPWVDLQREVNCPWNL